MPPSFDSNNRNVKRAMEVMYQLQLTLCRNKIFAECQVVGIFTNLTFRIEDETDSVYVYVSLYAFFAAIMTGLTTPAKTLASTD